jgi:hypothetical protein
MRKSLLYQALDPSGRKIRPYQAFAPEGKEEAEEYLWGYSGRM